MPSGLIGDQMKGQASKSFCPDPPASNGDATESIIKPGAPFSSIITIPAIKEPTRLMDRVDVILEPDVITLLGDIEKLPAANKFQLRRRELIAKTYHPAIIQMLGGENVAIFNLLTSVEIIIGQLIDENELKKGRKRNILYVRDPADYMNPLCVKISWSLVLSKWRIFCHCLQNGTGQVGDYVFWLMVA